MRLSLPDGLFFPPFPSFLCDPFFLSTFIHWISVFPYRPPFTFSTTSTALLLLPLSFFLLSLFSLHYSSLSSGERCLTQSPWSSRARWRGSWVWWTTCLALSATTTRCPPGPESTAPTRRSISNHNTTDDSCPTFHTSKGSYFALACRAAWKKTIKYISWLLKTPKIVCFP